MLVCLTTTSSQALSNTYSSFSVTSVDYLEFRKKVTRWRLNICMYSVRFNIRYYCSRKSRQFYRQTTPECHIHVTHTVTLARSLVLRATSWISEEDC